MEEYAKGIKEIVADDKAYNELSKLCHNEITTNNVDVLFDSEILSAGIDEEHLKEIRNYTKKVIESASN